MHSAANDEERTVTQRHAGYLVVLGEDIREDDAQRVLHALGMVKGVIRVTPIEAQPALEAIYLQRWKTELRVKLLAAVE